MLSCTMPLPQRQSLLQLHHPSWDPGNPDFYMQESSADTGTYILPIPAVDRKEKEKDRVSTSGTYKIRPLLILVEYLRVSSSPNSRTSFPTGTSSPLASDTYPCHSSFMSNLSFIYKLKNTKLLWLSAYFFFNLGLTLYNKAVLVHFPFPYTVTAIHALCGTLGGNVLLKQEVYVPAKLDHNKNMILYAFSGLYAINIVVSNVSLNLVSVPFHQVIRALTPVFTIALSATLLGIKSSPVLMLSLIPVVIGVCFATYGDVTYTRWGLCLTLLGTVLAALKTIFTSILQSAPSYRSFQGNPILGSDKVVASPRSIASVSTASFDIDSARLKLHPLDLLTRMSPLALAQCILYAYLTGETHKVATWMGSEMTMHHIFGIVGNGILAFGLNIVSFSANRRVGALGMTVAANVKQVLTILCAVTLFDLDISNINAFGIALTIAGGVIYAWIEHIEKRAMEARKF